MSRTLNELNHAFNSELKYQDMLETWPLDKLETEFHSIMEQSISLTDKLSELPELEQRIDDWFHRRNQLPKQEPREQAWLQRMSDYLNHLSRRIIHLLEPHQPEGDIFYIGENLIMVEEEQTPAKRC